MITQYKLTLKSVSGHPLYGDSAYRLYAFLLQQLPAEEADWLHEKAGSAISQHILFDKSADCYVWTLNLLSDEISSLLCPVLENMKEAYIENQSFPILSRSVQSVSPLDLIRQGQCCTARRNTVIFSSLTAFKQQGRYVIFPQERLILQSLVMRWNEVFPEYPVDDEDAFNAILSGIHIVDYRLKTSRFLLKGVRIPGFSGSCDIEARLALPLLELWNTLLLFSNYTGLGIKTGLGMGGVATKQSH